MKQLTTAYLRSSLIERTKQLRDEIKQLFLDAEHWNRLHPDEVIDPDPDGELAKLHQQLEEALRREGR